MSWPPRPKVRELTVYKEIYYIPRILKAKDMSFLGRLFNLDKFIDAGYDERFNIILKYQNKISKITDMMFIDSKFDVIKIVAKNLIKMNNG